MKTPADALLKTISSNLRYEPMDQLPKNGDHYRRYVASTTRGLHLCVVTNLWVTVILRGSERLYFKEVNDLLASHLKLLRLVHRAFKKTTFISVQNGKKQEQVHIGANEVVYMSLWGWLVRFLGMCTCAGGVSVT